MTVNDAGGAVNNAHLFYATPAVAGLTIHGTAGVPGGASSDYILADAPAVGANDWSVTGLYSGTLNSVVAFGGVDALLTGSSGADVFHFLPGGHLLEVGGAGGNNSTLDFSAYTPGITVTLSNGTTGGSVSGAVQVFNAISSIIGTAGNDTFRVPTGASIGGTISGGGGSDTLDYSGYSGNIQVSLLLGTATGVAGGISGIENVIGSSGNDLIVGDANANTLIGGTGRNVLIGGAGADTLDASRSSGDNLVIGGTTAYDNSLAALDAIFAEWTRTDLSFRDRYSDLTTGTNGSMATPLNLVNGQLILLTPTTVHADTSPDTLMGSNQTDPATGKRVHNWFFYDYDDVLVNYLSASDHKTQVH
jgi:Ca2+-binding RTX toxin-like protein